MLNLGDIPVPPGYLHDLIRAHPDIVTTFGSNAVISSAAMKTIVNSLCKRPTDTPHLDQVLHP